MRRNLFLITLIVLFCACQKNEMADEVNVQKGITCKVPGFEIANQTKTTLKLEVDDKGNSVLKFYWNSSDSVAVFGSTGTQQLAMSMKEIPVGSSATNHVNFTISEDFLLKKDNTYFAYAPIKNKSIYLNADAVPFDLSGQVQKTNTADDTDNLGAYDYIVSGATTAKENNVADFLFHHMCCPIRIKIEKVKAGTYQSITFSSSKAVFAVKGSIDVTNDTYNDGELASSVEIAYNEPVSVGQDGTLYAWMMIAPVSGEQLSDATLKVITHTSSGTVEEYELTNTVTEFVRGYAYAINASGSGGTIEPDVVDLKLPSGTLWATMDLGASIPEEKGTLYAWGEIDTKDSFTATNYYYGSKTPYSKYNTTDQIVILESDDDIVTMTYGDKYRMPSNSEVEELIEACDWVYHTGSPSYIEGTSKNNGQTIRFYSSSTATHFWLRNKSSSSSTTPYTLMTQSGTIAVRSSQARYKGFSVRAIKPKVPNNSL